MVDKVYYQATAVEVADGNIDQALWIKVTADNPGSDETTLNAKYIQQRARELAGTKTRRVITMFMPRIWWQWLLYAVAAFSAALLFAALLFNVSQVAGGIAFYVTFFGLLALPFILKTMWRKT